MRILLGLLLLTNLCFAQITHVPASPLKRPKLVVGIVVDQMRWDYLNRFFHRYARDGGFRRMMSNGFSCDNAQINYIPTYTACGHTTLYTGTVPAVHGITGNEWWDVQKKQEIYCVQDDSVTGVGTNERAGKMSPRNMLVTSICDELKLATNFRSKVIAVAFKDRGGILPAGHSADAAYWYEPASGKFISSSYYMNALPGWVNDFNNRNLPATYMKQGWNTLYPLNTYTQSTQDVHPAEGKPFGKDQAGFPYKLEQFIGNDFNTLTFTPYGNTVTKEMALAALRSERMGADSITDFLAVSFSSPDYIGHAFGPNSIEVEDNYLRLDKDIGDLLNYLDKNVGRGEYLVFLSADHGAAHAVKFMNERKLPAKSIDYGSFGGKVDSVLKARFGNYKFVAAEQNSQLFFDNTLIDSLKLNRRDVMKAAVDYLSSMEGVDRAFVYDEAQVLVLPQRLQTRIINGYYPKRCGDIQYILKPGYLLGSPTGTTHGSAYAYDAHIPLLWYGWNIPTGKSVREVNMTDVAPTLAALLRIQEPNGSIGQVIEELFEIKKR